MKVLLVITKGTWGGATKYVYDMARSLQKSGISVAVAYGPKGDLTEKLEKLSIPQYQIDGLERDLGFFKELRAYKGILSVIDDFEPDIVHVNSSKGGISALAARLKRKKVVFTSHGWAFNERRNIFVKLIFKSIYFFTILLSHKTILVSEALRKPIRSRPLQKKISVILNGVELLSPLTKEEAREKLSNIDSTLKKVLDKKWLFTIAELHDSKGIDVMLSALTTLRDEMDELPHYIVLGEGEEQWRLEQLVASYDLEKNVHFLGFVEQASQYIKAADIFILPSRTEALGYVLIEAGMAEVPIIASRVGGIPEIIEHNKNGLLVPSEGGVMFAFAISNLLADTAFQNKLGEALHKTILDTFSLDTMVSKTKDVYTTLLP